MMVDQQVELQCWIDVYVDERSKAVSKAKEELGRGLPNKLTDSIQVKRVEQKSDHYEVELKFYMPVSSNVRNLQITQVGGSHKWEQR